MATQKVFFFAVLVSIPLLIASFLKPVPDHLRNGFVSVTRPVLSAGESVRDFFTGSFNGFRNLVFLYKDNSRLKMEAARLANEVVALRETEKENERLRSLLDFKKVTPNRTIACEIIARNVTHMNNWLVLDKGARDGLKKDMPVVNQQGLVGKVAGVSRHTARVILLTDVESRVSGIIQNSRDTGLIYGDGTPLLKMKFLDLASSIKMGDTVLSSGLGSVYPKGIPIGIVHSVGKEKSGLYLSAMVKPLVVFSKTEEVLCLDFQKNSPGTRE
ncbi:MAG: rod shape-determining protein MreC [Omnitrophica bacterium GWA2_50_21]|nr:MAG: rod shape-determining protein MreC [Omnitrophica bacterium GWA2_50_21]